MIWDDPISGGLFGDAECGALWSAEAQVAHWLAFEAAWSEALGLDADGIAAFKPDMADLRAGMARDGVAIPALVKQLRAAFGEGVHKGATSQDVIDTALVLTLRGVFELIDARLEALHGALMAVHAAHGAKPLMGRTRMQAAVPITVADRVETWAMPVAQHRERLVFVQGQMSHVQVGGPAGNRAGIEGMAEKMGEALGLQVTPRAWHSRRDGVAAYGAWLSIVSGTIGKIGQDICLMAQQGVDEIVLSGGGGSSAMAHKANPIGAELLVTLARFNAAQLGGLHQAAIHEQERSGAAWALEWMILPQMTMATAKCLAVARDVIERIERIGDLDG